MNPLMLRYVPHAIGAIVIVASLLGIYMKGRTDGGDKVRRLWEQDRATAQALYDSELARIHAEEGRLRDENKLLSDDITAREMAHREAMDDARADIDSRRVESDRLRKQLASSGDSARRAASAAGCAVNAPAITRAFSECTQALERIHADADRVAESLGGELIRMGGIADGYADQIEQLQTYVELTQPAP